MRLLVQARYTGSLDDPCEMTHVVVDIDPRHLLDRRARLADVLALPQIYSVTFFNDTPQPVCCEFIDEEPDWFQEDAEVQAIADDDSPLASDLHIEAATIRYMPDGVLWRFYEKHTGESYETATVAWDVIQTAAKTKGGRHAKIPP
jgi:hypothetical protein